tara:strand:- start:513 stop:746 length:234 start_codon:yes stop_codon:yes gene_type:complete
MGSGSSTSQNNNNNNNNNNTILDIEIPSNIPLLPTDKSDRSDTHISASQDNKSKSQDIKSKNHIKYLDDKYKTIQDK